MTLFAPALQPFDLGVVSLQRDAVLAYIAPRIVKWWRPDDVVFDEVPLTATGKIDKKALRERYRTHLTALLDA